MRLLWSSRVYFLIKGVVFFQTLSFFPLYGVSTVEVTDDTDPDPTVAGTLRYGIGTLDPSPALTTVTFPTGSNVTVTLDPDTLGPIEISGKQVTIVGLVANQVTITDGGTASSAIFELVYPTPALATSLTFQDVNVSGDITSALNTTLAFAAENRQINVTSTISSAGPISKSGAELFSFTGDLTSSTGGITISEGNATFTINESGNVGSTITVSAASSDLTLVLPTTTQTFSVTSAAVGVEAIFQLQAASSTYSGNITQSTTANILNVVFEGSSISDVLTLSSTGNTYEGGTTIDAITVSAITAGALSSASAYTLTSGGLSVGVASPAPAISASIESITLDGSSVLTTIAGNTLSIITTGQAISGGGSVVANGTVAISNSTQTNTISGTVTGSGTISFGGTGSLIFTGDISGFLGTLSQSQGTVQVSNTATTNGIKAQLSGGVMNLDEGFNALQATITNGTLSALSTSTLTLTQSGGTFTIQDTVPSATITISGGVATVHDLVGVLTLNQTGGEFTVDATVNSGAITISNGTTTISDELFAGSVTMTGGVLTLTNSFQNPIAFTLSSSAVVNIDQDTNATVAATFSGTGGLVRKLGNGTITYSSATAYQGLFVIESGAAIINSSLATADCSVSSGAILSGTGSVHDLTVAGTFKPGNSIGTFTVTGDYLQQNGGELQIEFNDAGQIDLVDVTGTATLQNGALLRVYPDTGTYPDGMLLTFLQADGGIVGRYTGFRIENKSRLAPRSVSVYYTPTSIALYFFTPTNSILVENAPNEALLPLQAQLSRMIIDGQFDQFDTSDRFDRIEGACSESTYRVRAYGNESVQSGTFSHGNYETYSTLFGIDALYSYGSMGVFGQVVSATGHGMQTSQIDQMVYGGGVAVSLTAPTKTTIKALGSINFSSSGYSYESLAEQRSGKELLIEGMLQQDFCYYNWKALLEGGLRYAKIDFSGFSETIGLLESSVDAETYHSLDLSLGLTLAYSFNLGKSEITPLIGGSFLHSFQDNSHYTRVEYESTGTDFFTYIPNTNGTSERVFGGFQFAYKGFCFSVIAEKLFYSGQKGDFGLVLGAEAKW